MTTRSSIERLAENAPVPHHASWPARPAPSFPVRDYSLLHQRVSSAAYARACAAERGELCSDCPPAGYPTDKTRCAPCPHRTAYDRACAAIEATAAITARAMIKMTAAAYRLEPRYLDFIAEGLSDLSPRDLITGLKQMNAVAIMRGQRWVGFGGEVGAFNFRGACLYARYARAKQHQDAGRAR
jgi:hypothetical protein